MDEDKHKNYGFLLLTLRFCVVKNPKHTSRMHGRFVTDSRSVCRSECCQPIVNLLVFRTEVVLVSLKLGGDLTRSYPSFLSFGVRKIQ